MKKNPKLFGFVFLLGLFTFCFSIPGLCQGVESTKKSLPISNAEKDGFLKEFENFENLISLTEQNLKELLDLKTFIFEYKKQQNLFLDQPNNKELLLKTGKAAKKVLETIKEQHLRHIFDAKFLSELSLFEKMVKRPTLPKS